MIGNGNSVSKYDLDQHSHSCNKQIDCFVFEPGNSSNVSEYVYLAEKSSAKRHFMALRLLAREGLTGDGGGSWSL